VRSRKNNSFKVETFVLIAFVLSVSLLCLPAPAFADNPSWLSGWDYRKSHIINSSAGAGKNYNVNFTVFYGSGLDTKNSVYLNGHCRPDFGDVRFTASDGFTLLNYWIQSKFDNFNATFFVQVSDDLSVASRTIFIYYGNATATSASDIYSTFPFADDFNKGNLDPITQLSDKPILGVGGQGSFDEGVSAGGVKDPSILKVGSYYYMAYTAFNGEASIGLARSPDLLNWAKLGQILVKTQSWEDPRGLAAPFLMQVGSKIYLFYCSCPGGSGFCAIGYAYTTDIEGTWIKYENNPVLVPNPSAWDSGLVYDPAVIHVNSTYYLSYVGETFDGGERMLGLATASEVDFPNVWTKSDRNPIFDVEGSFGVEAQEIFASPSMPHYFFMINTQRYAECEIFCRYYSTDLFNWVAYPDNPYFTSSGASWDSEGVGSTASYVDASNLTLYTFYQGMDGGYCFRLGLASCSLERWKWLVSITGAATANITSGNINVDIQANSKVSVSSIYDLNPAIKNFSVISSTKYLSGDARALSTALFSDSSNYFGAFIESSGAGRLIGANIDGTRIRGDTVGTNGLYSTVELLVSGAKVSGWVKNATSKYLSQNWIPYSCTSPHYVFMGRASETSDQACQFSKNYLFVANYVNPSPRDGAWGLEEAKSPYISAKINGPQNITYTNGNVPVELSVYSSSTNPTVTYNVKKGSTWVYPVNRTYFTPTSLTDFADGSYVFWAFANNSHGSIDSASVCFSVLTIASTYTLSLTVNNPKNVTYLSSIIPIDCSISTNGTNPTIKYNIQYQNGSWLYPVNQTYLAPTIAVVPQNVKATACFDASIAEGLNIHKNVCFTVQAASQGASSSSSSETTTSKSSLNSSDEAENKKNLDVGIQVVKKGVVLKNATIELLGMGIEQTNGVDGVAYFSLEAGTYSVIIYDNNFQQIYNGTITVNSNGIYAINVEEPTVAETSPTPLPNQNTFPLWLPALPFIVIAFAGSAALLRRKKINDIQKQKN
jgi:predicted GH43/DUF377 family glycosyl hydrolase